MFPPSLNPPPPLSVQIPEEKLCHNAAMWNAFFYYLYVDNVAGSSDTMELWYRRYLLALSLNEQWPVFHIFSSDSPPLARLNAVHVLNQLLLHCRMIDHPKAEIVRIVEYLGLRASEEIIDKVPALTS